MKSFEAIVTVLDKASEPLRKAEERSMLLHKRLLQLEKVSGLQGLGEAARGLEERMNRMAGIAMRLAAPLLALGGGIGLGEVVNHAAELGEKLHLATQRTGVGTQQLSGWFVAARQAGVDTQSLTKSLERLQITAVNAASGKDPIGTLIFNRMHLGLLDAHGKVKNMAAQLPQIADEVKYLEDTGQHAVAVAMLRQIAGREGDALLPMLREGSQGLAQAMADAAQHGLLISPEKAESLEKLHKSMLGLRESVEGFGLAISEKLAPYLMPLMDWFAAWLDKIRSNGSLDRFIDGFMAAIERVNWQAIGDGIWKVADGIWKVAKAFHSFFKWLGGHEGTVGGIVTAAETVDPRRQLPFLAAAWAWKWVFGKVADLAGVGKNLPKPDASDAGFGGAPKVPLVSRMSKWLGFEDSLPGAPAPSPAGPSLLERMRGWLQHLNPIGVAHAQEMAESGGRQLDRFGNPLRSSAGAIGAMQLLPSTAQGVATKMGEVFNRHRFLFDKGYNEHLGQGYMGMLLRQFRGREDEALAAYNWGPSRVERAIKRWGENGFLAHTPVETQRYVESIFERASRDNGGAGSSAHIVIEHRNVPDNVRAHIDTRGDPDLTYTSNVGMAFAQ